MRHERQIPRRERGTAATLSTMAGLAWAGQDVPLATQLSPECLDDTLRRMWFYVPDGKVESIRTVERMNREYNEWVECDVDGVHFGLKPPGMIAGDCDEAATLAGAVLIHARKTGAVTGPITFVAARPGWEHEFKHVFLVFNFRGQQTRVDPTAPADADYSRWEMMTFNF